jgi:hypothetical protein
MYEILIHIKMFYGENPGNPGAQDHAGIRTYNKLINLNLGAVMGRKAIPNLHILCPLTFI